VKKHFAATRAGSQIVNKTCNQGGRKLRSAIRIQVERIEKQVGLLEVFERVAWYDTNARVLRQPRDRVKGFGVQRREHQWAAWHLDHEDLRTALAVSIQGPLQPLLTVVRARER
jgi:hypothetical protein